jgi:membrane-associated protease RseP (regulator of RpoE activity)
MDAIGRDRIPTYFTLASASHCGIMDATLNSPGDEPTGARGKPNVTKLSLITITTILVFSRCILATEIHVSPSGSDANPGTTDRPLQSFAAAQQAARTTRANTIRFQAGTYYLPETIVLTPQDAGKTFEAAAGQQVVLSGGSQLELTWQAGENGIWTARTPRNLVIDQLFVNGKRQRMARYPNYDPDARPYHGAAADAFSPERAARWTDPTGGFIHAMHRAHWGGYHYRITGKNDRNEVTYAGGWQNNRQMGMHPRHRFVENIFEELDAPGEWYHNQTTSTLYFYPPQQLDLDRATVEVVRLRHLLELQGNSEQPVQSVVLRGFTLRHAARTFMDVKEPLLRSDWTIYRGGAILCERTEDSTIADCTFDQLGGNAVFVNNYNRRLNISGCDFRDTGASAIAFVGDPQAVRNPLFEYHQRQRYEDIDKTPGPQSDNYPADCIVDDCLLRGFGLVEKQATGVQISMSMGITIRHCSIYDASRAGINISEGTFGGHLIEFCDVFDTVQETGDHGSFNSWGRDRFWHLQDAPPDQLPALALLDASQTTVLRNNRWRCDHGWDVDLDDGSSNYEIYNNLFLRGGLKLREGFHRRVWNNIAVSNSLHPHVWYDNSGDVVTGNIFMGPYRPAGGMPKGKWGETIDRNLFTTSDADRTKFSKHGCDAQSLVGDPLFVDPSIGDYRVKEESPALKIGFQNFPMDQFGVRRPNLRRIARTPVLPANEANVSAETKQRAEQYHFWHGARTQDLQGEAYSAFGVARDSGGVHLIDVPSGSAAAHDGFKKDDLIQSVNGEPVRRQSDLLRLRDLAAGKPLSIGIVRNQNKTSVQVESYNYCVADTGQHIPRDTIPLLEPNQTTPFSRITTRPNTHNEPTAVLHDGKFASNYGPVFGNRVMGGMYKIKLNEPTQLAEVNSWSYHLGQKRGQQRFILFGSNARTDPGWNVLDQSKYSVIAEVMTAFQKPGPICATSVRRSNDETLGTFRWLVWVVYPVTPIAENTAWQEFQVRPAGQ